MSIPSIHIHSLTASAGLSILDSDIIATDSIINTGIDIESTKIYSKRESHQIEQESGVLLEFDPKFYAGKWWIIAAYPLPKEEKWGRIPNNFYKNDAGKECPRSGYKYIWNRRSNLFNVTDTCYLSTNNYSREGIMIASDPKVPRKLKVIFNNKDGTKSTYDYWILLTDYDHYSIVGTPDKSYIQILTRKELISKKQAQGILRIVENLGYDADKLIAHNTIMK